MSLFCASRWLSLSSRATLNYDQRCNRVPRSDMYLLASVVVSIVVLLGAYPAYADRCGNLREEYNQLNSEYAQRFNEQQSIFPCDPKWSELHEQMMNFTREKLRVASRIEANGCRPRLTGGNSPAELQKLLVESPAEVRELLKTCAELTRQRPTERGQCSSPPPGKLVPADIPDWECILVENTNSDSECVYYFLFDRHTLKNVRSDLVKPTEINRGVCGEKGRLKFLRWERAPRSAQ